MCRAVRGPNWGPETSGLGGLACIRDTDLPANVYAMRRAVVAIGAVVAVLAGPSSASARRHEPPATITLHPTCRSVGVHFDPVYKGYEGVEFRVESTLIVNGAIVLRESISWAQYGEGEEEFALPQEGTMPTHAGLNRISIKLSWMEPVKAKSTAHTRVDCP
jgi:hypothetical protein